MVVVGFGEGSVDYVHVLSELPRPGQAKRRILSRQVTCGGQVATTMAACASLGLKAAYLGPLGNDENGRLLKAELTRRGVDLSSLIVHDAATRSAVILVEEHSGERIVLWDRDSRLDLVPSEITADLVAGADAVHVDGVDPAAATLLARLARHAGAIVTCDIDEVTPATRELLTHVSMPVLAQHVPRELTGITDLEAALRALRLNHDGLLCVTLGARGAAALDGNTFLAVPAPAVTAVDTTGAGDVFRAGFIYGVLQQWPAERVLSFANTAAAVSCTRTGAMAGVPAFAEVSARLRDTIPP